MKLKRSAKYGLAIIGLGIIILIFNLLFLLPDFDASSLDSYLEKNLSSQNNNGVITDAYKIYGGNEDELYLWYAFEEWNQDKQDIESGGSSAVVVFLNENREAIGHRTPRDGDDYTNSMRELFPFFVRARMTPGNVPNSIEKAIDIQQTELQPEN